MDTDQQFEQNTALALKELEGTSISRWIYLPLYYRVARQFGLKVRPPHYNSFVGNAIGNGFFGAFIASVIVLGDRYLKVSGPDTLTALESVIFVVFATVFLGILGAYSLRSTARKHGLSQWERLSEDTNRVG